ncbi:MAG: hypothetical protein JW885_02655 [Deltaproteobacteria bacterium]|nr:hypothetical protein [Candidatus Zymogenaceae bacterium]
MSNVIPRIPGTHIIEQVLLVTDIAIFTFNKFHQSGVAALPSLLLSHRVLCDLFSKDTDVIDKVFKNESSVICRGEKLITWEEGDCDGF